MVDGERMQGKRIKFSIKSSSYSWEEAQRILYQYPLNSTAKVYYNPRNPSNAVLIPGPIDGMYCLIIGGVALIIIGVIPIIIF